jgi:ribonuclease P protein component
MTTPRFTFPKTHRLRTAAEFKVVYDAKCSVAEAALVVYFLPNPRGHPRLGLSVSRKFGNAVHRNRMKRLLREAFRHLQYELPTGDIICVARRTDKPLSLDDAKALVMKLANAAAIRWHHRSPRPATGDAP